MNTTYKLGKQEQCHHFTLADLSLQHSSRVDIRKTAVGMRYRSDVKAAYVSSESKLRQQRLSRRHRTNNSRKPVRRSSSEYPPAAENELFSVDEHEAARRYIVVCEETQRTVIRFEELRKFDTLIWRFHTAFHPVSLKPSENNISEDQGDFTSTTSHSIVEHAAEVPKAHQDKDVSEEKASERNADIVKDEVDTCSNTDRNDAIKKEDTGSSSGDFLNATKDEVDDKNVENELERLREQLIHSTVMEAMNSVG